MAITFRVQQAAAANAEAVLENVPRIRYVYSTYPQQIPSAEVLKLAHIRRLEDQKTCIEHPVLEEYALLARCAVPN